MLSVVRDRSREGTEFAVSFAVANARGSLLVIWVMSRV